MLKKVTCAALLQTFEILITIIYFVLVSKDNFEKENYLLLFIIYTSHVISNAILMFVILQYYYSVVEHLNKKRDVSQ